MDEEEYASMDPEDDEQDVPQGESQSEESPVNDLEDLAQQYGIPGPREAFAQLSKSAEESRAALREARERILARKYNKALPLLAASAAFGAPTRTGSFGETFSNLSSNLMGPIREHAQFERARDEDLLKVGTDLSAVDERMADRALKLAALLRKSASGSDETANIQNFKFLRNLDPEGYDKLTPKQRQDLMLLSIRNPDMWTGKVNEAVISVDPTGRRGTRVYSTTQSEADAAEKLAGSRAEGTDLGKTVAQAKADLPVAETAASYITGLLDKLKSHPGKKWVVGWPEGFNLGEVARTPAKGFATRLAQIKGKQFLTAYQALRGAGAITVEEGTRAGEAEARMNSAQRVEDFDEAADEYKQIVKTGIENLRKRSKLRSSGSGGSGAPSGPPRIKGDADYDALKSGTVFIDPDGNQRTKP